MMENTGDLHVDRLSEGSLEDDKDQNNIIGAAVTEVSLDFVSGNMSIDNQQIIDHSNHSTVVDYTDAKIWCDDQTESLKLNLDLLSMNGDSCGQYPETYNGLSDVEWRSCTGTSVDSVNNNFTPRSIGALSSIDQCSPRVMSSRSDAQLSEYSIETFNDNGLNQYDETTVANTEEIHFSVRSVSRTTYNFIVDQNHICVNDAQTHNPLGTANGDIGEPCTISAPGTSIKHDTQGKHKAHDNFSASERTHVHNESNDSTESGRGSGSKSTTVSEDYNMTKLDGLEVCMSNVAETISQYDFPEASEHKDYNNDASAQSQPLLGATDEYGSPNDASSHRHNLHNTYISPDLSNYVELEGELSNAFSQGLSHNGAISAFKTPRLHNRSSTPTDLESRQDLILSLSDELHPKIEFGDISSNNSEVKSKHSFKTNDCDELSEWNILSESEVGLAPLIGAMNMTNNTMSLTQYTNKDVCPGAIEDASLVDIHAGRSAESSILLKHSWPLSTTCVNSVAKIIESPTSTIVGAEHLLPKSRPATLGAAEMSEPALSAGTNDIVGRDYRGSLSTQSADLTQYTILDTSSKNNHVGYRNQEMTMRCDDYGLPDPEAQTVSRRILADFPHKSKAVTDLTINDQEVDSTKKPKPKFTGGRLTDKVAHLLKATEYLNSRDASCKPALTTSHGNSVHDKVYIDYASLGHDLEVIEDSFKHSVPFNETAELLGNNMSVIEECLKISVPLDDINECHSNIKCFSNPEVITPRNDIPVLNFDERIYSPSSVSDLDSSRKRLVWDHGADIGYEDGQGRFIGQLFDIPTSLPLGEVSVDEESVKLDDNPVPITSIDVHNKAIVNQESIIQNDHDFYPLLESDGTLTEQSSVIDTDDGMSKNHSTQSDPDPHDTEGLSSDTEDIIKRHLSYLKHTEDSILKHSLSRISQVSNRPKPSQVNNNVSDPTEMHKDEMITVHPRHNDQDEKGQGDHREGEKPALCPLDDCCSTQSMSKRVADILEQKMPQAQAEDILQEVIVQEKELQNRITNERETNGAETNDVSTRTDIPSLNSSSNTIDYRIAEFDSPSNRYASINKEHYLSEVYRYQEQQRHRRSYRSFEEAAKNFPYSHNISSHMYDNSLLGSPRLRRHGITPGRPSMLHHLITDEDSFSKIYVTSPRNLSSPHLASHGPFTAFRNARTFLSEQLEKAVDKDFDKSIELRTPLRRVIECYPLYSVERHSDTGHRPSSSSARVCTDSGFERHTSSRNVSNNAASLHSSSKETQDQESINCYVTETDDRTELVVTDERTQADEYSSQTSLPRAHSSSNDSHSFPMEAWAQPARASYSGSDFRHPEGDYRMWPSVAQSRSESGSEASRVTSGDPHSSQSSSDRLTAVQGPSSNISLTDRRAASASESFNVRRIRTQPLSDEMMQRAYPARPAEDTNLPRSSNSQSGTELLHVESGNDEYSSVSEKRGAEIVLPDQEVDTVLATRRADDDLGHQVTDTVPPPHRPDVPHEGADNSLTSRGADIELPHHGTDTVLGSRRPVVVLPHQGLDTALAPQGADIMLPQRKHDILKQRGVDQILPQKGDALLYQQRDHTLPNRRADVLHHDMPTSPTRSEMRHHVRSTSPTRSEARHDERPSSPTRSEVRHHERPTSPARSEVRHHERPTSPARSEARHHERPTSLTRSEARHHERHTSPACSEVRHHHGYHTPAKSTSKISDSSTGRFLPSEQATSSSSEQSNVSPTDSESSQQRRAAVAKYRPYKPATSPDMYYVESEMDDRASVTDSVTTMESTHAGSDDALGPVFPSDILGSRIDNAPANSTGVYGNNGKIGRSTLEIATRRASLSTIEERSLSEDREKTSSAGSGDSQDSLVSGRRKHTHVQKLASPMAAVTSKNIASTYLDDASDSRNVLGVIEKLTRIPSDWSASDRKLEVYRTEVDPHSVKDIANGNDLGNDSSDSQPELPTNSNDNINSEQNHPGGHENLSSESLYRGITRDNTDSLPGTSSSVIRSGEDVLRDIQDRRDMLAHATLQVKESMLSTAESTKPAVTYAIDSVAPSPQIVSSPTSSSYDIDVKSTTRGALLQSNASTGTSNRQDSLQTIDPSQPVRDRTSLHYDCIPRVTRADLNVDYANSNPHPCRNEEKNPSNNSQKEIYVYGSSVDGGPEINSIHNIPASLPQTQSTRSRYSESRQPVLPEAIENLIVRDIESRPSILPVTVEHLEHARARFSSPIVDNVSALSLRESPVYMELEHDRSLQREYVNHVHDRNLARDHLNSEPTRLRNRPSLDSESDRVPNRMYLDSYPNRFDGRQCHIDGRTQQMDLQSGYGNGYTDQQQQMRASLTEDAVDRKPMSASVKRLQETLEQESDTGSLPDLHHLWTRFQELQSDNESSMDSVRLEALINMIKNPTGYVLHELLREQEKNRRAKQEFYNPEKLDKKPKGSQRPQYWEPRQEQKQNGCVAEQSNRPNPNRRLPRHMDIVDGSYSETIDSNAYSSERSRDEKGFRKSDQSDKSLRKYRKELMYDESTETLYSIPEDASLEGVEILGWNSTELSDDLTEQRLDTKRHRHVIDPNMEKLKEKIGRQKVKFEKQRRRELKRLEKIQKLEHLLSAKEEGKISKHALLRELENISSSTSQTTASSESATTLSSETSSQEIGSSSTGTSSTLTSARSDFSEMTPDTLTPRSNTTEQSSDVTTPRYDPPSNKTKKAKASPVKKSGVCFFYSPPRKKHFSNNLPPQRKRTPSPYKSRAVRDPPFRTREVQYKKSSPEGKQSIRNRSPSPNKKQPRQEQLSHRGRKSPKKDRKNAQNIAAKSTFKNKRPGDSTRDVAVMFPSPEATTQERKSRRSPVRVTVSEGVQTTPRIWQSPDRDETGVITVPMNKNSRAIRSRSSSPKQSSRKTENIPPSSADIRQSSPHGSLSWYVPFAEPRPWRKPLQERQNLASDRAVLLDARRETKDIPVKLFMTRDDWLRKTDHMSDDGRNTSLTKMTLQEAFRTHKSDVISHLRGRQRHLVLAAEERRLNEYLRLEREKLFSQQRKRGPKHEPHPGSENLFEARRRVMSKQEMKESTQRLWSQLPEVVQKGIDQRRKDEWRANLIRSKLFSKKVQRKVLNAAGVWLE